MELAKKVIDLSRFSRCLTLTFIDVLALFVISFLAIWFSFAGALFPFEQYLPAAAGVFTLFTLWVALQAFCAPTSLVLRLCRETSNLGVLA